MFDAYRPQSAVDHFVRWAADPADDRTRAEYYPDVPKSELFARGYIAEASGHSRGSTVDLTVVRLADGAELDMGTPFDFFGPESAVDYEGLTGRQRANRRLLADAMQAHGFEPYPAGVVALHARGRAVPRYMVRFPGAVNAAFPGPVTRHGRAGQPVAPGRSRADDRPRVPPTRVAARRFAARCDSATDDVSHPAPASDAASAPDVFIR